MKQTAPVATETRQSPAPVARHCWWGAWSWLQAHSLAPGWLPRWARQPLTGFLAAVLLEATGVALTAILMRIFGGFPLQGVLELLLVMVVALTFGAGPSILATLLGALLLKIFVLPPIGAFDLAQSRDTASVVFYLVAGAVVTILAARAEDAQTEAATRAGELEAVFESMTDGVVVYGPAGEVRWINPAYRRLLALDDEALRRPYVARGEAIVPRRLTGEPLPYAEWPSMRIRKGAVLTGPQAMDVLARAHDGREVLLNCAGAPVHDARGRLHGAVLVARDVTETRRLEHEAMQRAARLQAIFDAIGDSVTIYEMRDGQPRVAEMNAASYALFGFAQGSDVVGRTAGERAQILSIRSDLGKPLATDELPHARVLRGEILTGEHTQETLVRSLDGREIAVSVSGVPIRDAAGEIVGAVLVNRDVTERRQLEHRTQAALEALLEMAEAVVLNDMGGAAPDDATLRVVARRMAELIRQVVGCTRVFVTTVEAETEILRSLAAIGLSPEHEAYARAHPPGDVRLGELLRPEDAAALRAGTIRITDLGEEGLRDARNPYQTRSVLVAPCLLQGELVGVLTLDYGSAPHIYTAVEQALARAVGQLTALLIERERLLEARAAAQAQVLALKETNAQMNVFLSIAGHELRTPLTSMKVNIQMAERRLREQLAFAGADSRQQEKLGTIGALLRRTAGQIERQERLVNDLVDVARIETGRLELAPGELDLAAVVRDVVEEQRLVNPSRTISLELPTDGQPVPVLADADRIGQVLTNYLTNALKYSAPEAPVEVWLREEDARVRVCVRDHGPGLPRDEQERIWERFHRVDGIEVQSGSGIGLGLGLYISREMIERHGGQAGVESTPGDGSTFWFTLPRKPA